MTEYHPTYRPDLLARIPKNEAQMRAVILWQMFRALYKWETFRLNALCRGRNLLS